MGVARRILAWLVLGTILTWQSSVLAANKIKSVRIWPAPDSTRVVFDLSAKPDFSYFSLASPNRLVIDFKNSKNLASLKKIKAGGIISRIRTSKAKKKGWTRIVLELKQKISPKVFPLAPTAPYGDRLVVDFHHKGKGSTAVKRPSSNRDVVIAVDAGHGGEDPGSIGSHGNYEKHVALKIAKRLAQKINATKGMQAVLIRKGDYHVGLNRRSEIARKHKADLLVSIHADAFHSPKPNGASVWVQSMKRANSEIGRWLEKREKHSELLGGAAEVIQDTNSEKYLARALLDMSMDHSLSTSYDISKLILRHLKPITKLHKKTPQALSLAVLKAPDIPSLLVETGFISNPGEEKRLVSSSHQAKLATAMHRAISEYFMANPPEGTLLAKQGSFRHKVRSGESLSLLAQRYNVSVKKIKAANKLSSNTVRIGQVLTIPRI